MYSYKPTEQIIPSTRMYKVGCTHLFKPRSLAFYAELDNRPINFYFIFIYCPKMSRYKYHTSAGFCWNISEIYIGPTYAIKNGRDWPHWAVVPGGIAHECSWYATIGNAIDCIAPTSCTPSPRLLVWVTLVYVDLPGSVVSLDTEA